MVKISSLCKYLVIVECIHQIRFLAYVFVVILQHWDRMHFAHYMQALHFSNVHIQEKYLQKYNVYIHNI